MSISEITEDEELKKLIAASDAEYSKTKKKSVRRRSKKNPLMSDEADMPIGEDSDAVTEGKLVQWSIDSDKFFPINKTTRKLPPGYYEICHCNSRGLYLQKFPVILEGLLRFPDSNSDKVMSEIKLFWQKEDTYKKHGLCYKRGILLWGPPGGGKSCTVQLVSEDLIEHGGIIIKWLSNAGLLRWGMRSIREIQPNTPIIILMEDLDAILDDNDDSDVLNLLDGVDKIDKVVYLATTNYPERLGARIIDRPSRFDRRIKIGMPTPEARRLFFEHLVSKDGVSIDVQKWIKDTDGFSLAHLKELFVSTAILGCTYEMALEILKSMKDKISSESDHERTAGFSIPND